MPCSWEEIPKLCEWCTHVWSGVDRWAHLADKWWVPVSLIWVHLETAWRVWIGEKEESCPKCFIHPGDKAQS